MADDVMKALQASEASFRTLIEKNADAVMIIRADGMICFVNPAAELLLGQASSQLVGEMFGIPLTSDEAVEIDIPRGESDARVAEMRVVPIAWEGQHCYLASLRDITERKEASDAMRFLAEASRLLAGSLDVPTTISSVGKLTVALLADWCTIDLLDDDSRAVRRVAVAHADPLLTEVAESLKETWSPIWEAPNGLPKVLTSGQAEVHQQVGRSLLEALASGPDKLRILEQLGCKSVMIVPLLARGRTLGAIMFVSAHATHRYRTNDLNLARDLAARAALAIDNARLYEDSQLAVRRRDEFLAMLGHELRNPLAAIQNAVDLMRLAGLYDPQQQRIHGVIERQVQQMGRLLDDLLDMARVMRGKIVLRRRQLDLANVVQHAVQTSQSLIDAHQHQLQVTLPPSPIFVDADATRLEQILVNLLSNAAKYTPPGGQIHLILDHQDGDAVVRVCDNGEGIAQDVLPAIFDLFVQADRSLARSEGGLGIGLTLVRQLVEMHGGRVEATSPGKNQGSEFVVRLPLARATAPSSTPAGARSTIAKRRIVIVEDNDDAREMLNHILVLDGHEVHLAKDGREGVELILRVQPDVALVDIGLPDVSGWELAEQVRAELFGKPLRLIAITGYGQDTDLQRAMSAGFDHHLVKPVRYDQLCTMLNS